MKHSRRNSTTQQNLAAHLTPTAADMRKTGLALRNALADAIERDRRKASVAK
jgi:hypothetical protein